MVDFAETNSNTSDTDKAAEISNDHDEEVESEVIDVNLHQLLSQQRSALTIALLTIIVQIIILTNLQVVTGFFQFFISGNPSYRQITEFVATFLATLAPYIFVLIVFGFMYQIYQILLNDKKKIKDFSDIFEILTYILLGVFTLIVVFGALRILTYTQFSIFIFMILLFIIIFFFPLNYLHRNNIPKKDSERSHSMKDSETQ